MVGRVDGREAGELVAVAHQTFFKQPEGTAKAERKARKLAAKAGREPETHQQTLDRLEFWRSLRLELFARDSGKCRACAKPLDLNAGISGDAFHAHHLLFRSQGGTDELVNLIALCSVCHRLCHDGRLTICGTVDALQFTLRTLKGTISRAWESVLKVAPLLAWLMTGGT